MNRRILIALAAAVACVVLVAFAWHATHRPAAANASGDRATTPAVATAVARYGSVEEHATAQGRVGPPAGSSAKVAFAEAGILRAVDVRVGEVVAAGQPVAEIDRSALVASVAQARADARAAGGSYGGGAVPAAAVRSAEAKRDLAAARLQMLQRGGPSAQSDQIAAQEALRQAQLKVDADRATLARQNVLLAGGVVAAKDVQTARNQLASDVADVRTAEAKVASASVGFAASLRQARADYDSAVNELRAAQAQTTVLGAQTQSAQARLAAAQVAYDQGVLRAPDDGVVYAVLKHPGEAVDPSAPVVEIGPAAARAITLTVPGDTARRVRVGARATMQLTASNERAEGRVTAVVPAVDPSTQSATVTVSGAPADAVPGDAVTASIALGRVAGIVVPSSAIVEDPQTGSTVVFVRQRDGSFASREVIVRGADGGRAVVSGRLAPGQRLATQGAYELLAPPGG